MRGLRFRLMASYALFFGILLIGVDGLFRARLVSTLDTRAHDLLNQEWAALKAGVLRIDKSPETSPVPGKNAATWWYDAVDPDETTTVLDIKKIYLRSDA